MKKIHLHLLSKLQKAILFLSGALASSVILKQELYCIYLNFLVNHANLIIKDRLINRKMLKSLIFSCLLSEAFLEYSSDVFAFSHCVEMYRWHSVCDEVLALLCAPFCTNLIDSVFVITELCHLLGQFNRDVQ